jgi:hypothetical protein
MEPQFPQHGRQLVPWWLTASRETQASYRRGNRFPQHLVLRPLQFPSLQHLEARVAAICDRAQKSEGLSEKTIVGWRTAFLRLRSFLRVAREEDFLRGDVEDQTRTLLDWIAWLRDGGANHTTVNTYWRALHAILARLSVEEGTIDPTLFVESPHPRHGSSRATRWKTCSTSYAIISGEVATSSGPGTWR